jgi:purine catabolism regulator
MSPRERTKERARREYLETTLKSLTSTLDIALRQRLRITAGDPVTDISSLGRNMRTARSASRINELLGNSASIRYASELGAHQLLANSVPDRTLELFVDEQIGALIDADARGSRDLVGTLEALARAGFSKTIASEALGIRRQTLHNRLGKIAEVLGPTALEDPERRFSLQVALVAWRLRISAAARS